MKIDWSSLRQKMEYRHVLFQKTILLFEVYKKTMESSMDLQHLVPRVVPRDHFGNGSVIEIIESNNYIGARTDADVVQKMTFLYQKK